MKKILIGTDFSPAAENASRYALQLACYLQANIELFHGFEVPVISSALGTVAWSAEDDQAFRKQQQQQMESFAKELDKADRMVRPDFPWIPRIAGNCEEGGSFKLIADRKDKKDIYMLAIGTSHASASEQFFFGSKVHKAIQYTGLPVLVVPPLAAFSQIRKIAFATDLKESDLEILHALSGLARPFNAEILIVHVTEEKNISPARQSHIDAFLKEVICKVNYPKIYYRHLTERPVDEGLDWLTDHGQIDLLAMVHRTDRLFKVSHSLKMANHTALPLLVFTENASLSGFMADCL